MKQLLTILFLCATLMLSGQRTTIREITIDPYLVFQHYEHFKRLTLSSPDSQAEHVKGFSFEWGYTYRLSVQETELSVGLSDGTKYTYTLKAIVSKTRVPDSTQFTLLLDGARYYGLSDSSDQAMNATLKPINENSFLYFDEVEIEVPEHLKASFSAIIQSKTTRKGSFVFVNEKRIRLVGW